jgi:hypothetical protein
MRDFHGEEVYTAFNQVLRVSVFGKVLLNQPLTTTLSENYDLEIS